MPYLRITIKLPILVATLALLAAACGGVGTQPPPADTGTPGDVAVTGTCLREEPDCNDTPPPGPPPSLADADAGFVTGGGLTVPAALATDATGPIAVSGFLVDDGTTARLCEALAESYPPQCGGAGIPLIRYDAAELAPLSTNGAVTWSDSPVIVFGTIVDGALVAAEGVTG